MQADGDNRRLCRIVVPSYWCGLLATAAAAATNLPATPPGADAGTVSSDFVSQWFVLSDAAKESQPHWMTPIVTVTPRLEQECRYDQSWQSKPDNVDLDNYDGGKGFEIIPTSNTEVIIGVPPYEIRDTPKGETRGWGDESLLLKYRFLAANEEQGNYIVTGFLGVSLPSGDEAFSNHKAIITPTIAAGKGWGTRQNGVDIQSTLGIGIPVVDEASIGMPITWNTSLQGHVGKLWPEIDANYTAFKDGPNAGKDQFAMTAGVVVGRFELGRRARLIVGAGYQWPLTTLRTLEHTWLGTARLAF